LLFGGNDSPARDALAYDAATMTATITETSRVMTNLLRVAGRTTPPS
jgi:hypothetical protein